MTDTSHSGSCHCGAIRFHVDIDLEQPVIACNCSMCARAGTLLAFVPASSFTLKQGEDHLTDYRFHKKEIAHFFCKTCGIKPFGRGNGPHGPMAAINVRCLDDFEENKVKIQHVDGKNA